MSGFTHVTVGSNDVGRARMFYDPVLASLGWKRLSDVGELASLWGQEFPAFVVLTPIDGQPATHANGGTIGFEARDPAMVDAFHAAGMANGGLDEGGPGPRVTARGNAYGAFLRDPDGNKICSFCHGEDL